MTARVCFSLITALLCLSVYLSTTDAEGAATVNGSVHLAAAFFPAKPGVCPRKNLGVAVSGVCAEMCFDDRDCPKNKKCCSNGCGHECMVPYKGPAKPGVCPKNNVEDAMLGVCDEMCSHDSDCPKNQKCCSNGCGHECMVPYKEKPGACPKKLGVGVCVEMCSHDSDCPKNQKCCSNGCGHQCMPPYKGPAKPGVCPRKNLGVAVSGVCVEMCSHDGDCPKNQKCCSNGCGHKCMAPYKEKPGVCPKKLGVAVSGVCADMCSHDGDCPNDEKCCSNGCGHQCTDLSIEKPGVCPRGFDGVRLCKELCVNDNDCPNDEKCCRTKCGHACISPF